jgi:peptidylprolyl isomerase
MLKKEKGTGMAQARKGDTVKINYTGTLEDGTVFDSTHEHEECSSEECGCGGGPREITLGAGEFLNPLEDALVGMSVGETKKVIIPAEDAFGEYDLEKVFSIPRSDLPEDLKPEVDDEIVLVNQDDEELAVVVVEVNDEEITFDANHPLAGEDVTFEMELVEIL